MSKAKRQEKKQARKEKRAEKKIERKASGKGLKNFIKKSAKKLASVGENIVFAPLLPFKKLMSKELDKKNITHDKTIHDIAIKFGKNIVGVSHFEEMQFETLYADAEEKRGSLGKAIVSAGTGDATGVAKNLITAIVNYFKKLKDKKAKGEKLTENEEKILREADTISSQVIEAVQEDLKEEAGNIFVRIKDWTFSKQGGLTILAIALLIWGYFKFVKK